MGGGNANKTMMKRAKNAEKAAKEAGGKQGAGLKAQAAQMSVICAKCRQPFCSTAQKDLLIHLENKHAGCTFAECFPGVELKAPKVAK